MHVTTNDRDRLRKAAKKLNGIAYELDAGKRINASGELVAVADMISDITERRSFFSKWGRRCRR